MTDLVELARKAENYVLHSPDKRLGWVPHFIGRILPGPPCFIHTNWDACDVGWRLVEAAAVIRRMTGEPMTREEECLRRMVFSTLMPDGLSYRRLEDWGAHEAWMWDQGRALLALTTLIEREDDPLLVRIGTEMLRGLERIAMPFGEQGLYYPVEGWLGSGWGDSMASHPPTGLQIEGAVLFAQRTGEEWPLEFARKVAHTVLNRPPRLLNDDGSLVPNGGGDFKDKSFIHLHSRLFITLGLARLAEASGDSELLGLARRVLDCALRFSTSYGWVPECPDRPGPQMWDELCCIMDVVKLAFFFARRGETGLYDVVERFVANQVPAHQINDFERVADKMDRTPPPADTRTHSYQGVLDRFRGGFTGSLFLDSYPLFYDNDYHLDVIGCCAPSGVMSLYLAWEAALEESDDGATIWMHFPREGRLVKVESPAKGGGSLVVTPKRELARARIRVHPWADRASVRALAGGSAVPVRFEGDLAILQNLKPGTPVSFQYPAARRSTTERVAGQEIRVDWIGNEVASIPPQEGFQPVYPMHR